MTACESSDYTGASFSITVLHYTPFFRGVVGGGGVIDNILFSADVQIISSVRQQLLVLGLFSSSSSFFQRV